MPVRICLVAREYEAFHYGRHLVTLINLAEKHRCETLVFSLFSIDRRCRHSIPKLLEGCRHLKRIVLESGDLWNETGLRTELWLKHFDDPFVFKRQFAQSSESPEQKIRFVHQIPFRVFDKNLILICGETNVLKVDRSRKRVVDPLRALPAMKRANVQIILSPWHTRAFRYEMNEKRKALSKGRLLISVWNTYRARGRDGAYPWIAFANGKDITERVQELPRPIPGRSDIRVGILSTSRALPARPRE